MASNGTLRGMLLCGALLGVSIAAAGALPPASHTTNKSAVRAQLKDVDAKIAAARAHNATLQSQVSGMEQKNDAQRKLLQHRDAEIAALQQKLEAAGAPASAASAGH